MNEQQPTTSNDEQSGLDRRKFLLRTTAVTAGAWAAPSILTIDRAFGATGSPTPCACGPNTVTDGATVKGSIVVPLVGTVIPIRLNACLNDDDIGVGPVELPEGLGTVTVAGGGCGECSSGIQVVSVDLTVGGHPITAEALEAEAKCCDGKADGGSSVYNVRIGALGPFTSTTYQSFGVGDGFVALNERPESPGGSPGEFNALHVHIPTPGNGLVDLKIASAKVVCA